MTHRICAACTDRACAICPLGSNAICAAVVDVLVERDDDDSEMFFENTGGLPLLISEVV
jgi:hypothetical protein